MTPTTTPKTRSVGNVNRAAYLMAHRLTPGILPGDYVRFLFNDTDGHASDLLAQWDEGSAQVEPRAFVAALNQARNLVAYHRTTEGGAE